LIGGEVIAIDGTKSRAHNSKKANFNQIDKHLAYIEAKTKNTWALWKKMIEITELSKHSTKIDRLRTNYVIEQLEETKRK
jgi:hypothetical protein